jgi:hypothetical protein
MPNRRQGVRAAAGGWRWCWNVSQVTFGRQEFAAAQRGGCRGRPRTAMLSADEVSACWGGA